MTKWMRGILGIGCLLAITGPAGCLAPAGGNNDNNNSGGGNIAPSANAGADQTVARGGLVTLDASASDDADGDSLTFSWAQVSGASVVLSGSTAAQPQFAAPSTAGTLLFEVTVSDGNGGTDKDSVTIEVEGARGTLSVANNDSGRVTIYDLSDLDGEVEPILRIDAGATTSLFQVRSIVATQGGEIIASRQNGGLAFFADNLNAAGNVPAAAVLEGASTKLEMPISLALDDSASLLYVGNVNAASGILVFDVSNVGGGNVAPLRMFSPPDRAPFNSTQMTLDALWLHDGALYASDTSGLNANSSRILVFADAAAASGQATPVRTITSADFGNIEDIIIDSNDILYVVDGTNQVKVFDNASTRNGVLTPDRVITIGGTPAPDLQGIALSSDGIGYLADRENSAIYSINDIATQGGAVVPSATLSGFNTRLAGPRQMFVLES